MNDQSTSSLQASNNDNNVTTTTTTTSDQSLALGKEQLKQQTDVSKPPSKKKSLATGRPKRPSSGTAPLVSSLRDSDNNNNNPTKIIARPKRPSSGNSGLVSSVRRQSSKITTTGREEEETNVVVSNLRFGKNKRFSNSSNHERPGAFAIHRRAPGAMPAWFRRLRSSLTRQRNQQQQNENNRDNTSSTNFGSLPFANNNNNDGTATQQTNNNDDSHIPPELRGVAIFDISALMRQDDDDDDVHETSGNIVQSPKKEKQQQQQQQKIRIYVGIFIMLILVGVAIGVGVGVGLKKKNTDNSGTKQTSNNGNVDIIGISFCDNRMLPRINDLPAAFISCACFQTLPIKNENKDLQTRVKSVLMELYKNRNNGVFMNDAAVNTSSSLNPIWQGCHHNNIALHWLLDDIVRTNNTNQESWKNRYLLASLFSFWTDGGLKRWKDATGWLSTMPECLWAGVGCEDDDGKESSNETASFFSTRANRMVSHLQLASYGNKGIPVELYLFPALSFLNLADNDLGTSISSEIGLLSNLEFLWMSNSDIKGSLPDALYTLTNLRSIQIGSNRELKGALSTRIGLLENLVIFHGLGLGLSGTIPTEVATLGSLRSIGLDSPNLEGQFPIEIFGKQGKLTRLTELVLRANGLTVELPTEIGRLESLERLDFQVQWNGTLPSEIGKLTRLVSLDLFSGLVSLTGTIPTEIGYLTMLTRLSMPGHGFGGMIPSEIGLLRSLTFLNLRLDTQLSGQIPTEFGQLTKLGVLDVSATRLRGTLPSELGQILSSVCFDFSDTPFLSGETPREWCGNEETTICIDPRRLSCGGGCCTSSCSGGGCSRYR